MIRQTPLTLLPAIIDNSHQIVDTLLHISKKNKILKKPDENIIIQADNLSALTALVLSELSEAIDLIYIDPPFASMKDYFRRGETLPAFADQWNGGIIEYLSMICPRLILMHKLLSQQGNIFVHVDHHASAYIRIILDELFGTECFRNEIIWCYRQGGRSNKNFSHKHDTIYWYSKSPDNWIFNADSVRIPYNGSGGYQRSGRGVTINGRTYRPNSLGKIPEDWWDIAAIPPMSAERNGYPTQKPEALIERIVKACSNEHSIVADFFAGSGTLPYIANQTSRQWIAVDKGTKAIETMLMRLSDTQFNFVKL